MSVSTEKNESAHTQPMEWEMKSLDDEKWLGLQWMHTAYDAEQKKMRRMLAPDVRGTTYKDATGRTYIKAGMAGVVEGKAVVPILDSMGPLFKVVSFKGDRNSPYNKTGADQSLTIGLSINQPAYVAKIAEMLEAVVELALLLRDEWAGTNWNFKQRFKDPAEVRQMVLCKSGWSAPSPRDKNNVEAVQKAKEEAALGALPRMPLDTEWPGILNMKVVGSYLQPADPAHGVYDAQLKPGFIFDLSSVASGEDRSVTRAEIVPGAEMFVKWALLGICPDVCNQWRLFGGVMRQPRANNSNEITEDKRRAMMAAAAKAGALSDITPFDGDREEEEAHLQALAMAEMAAHEAAEMAGKRKREEISQ